MKAVLGKKGIVAGRDFRGKPVLADVREVPDSPWFVVARVDLLEVTTRHGSGSWWMVSLWSAFCPCRRHLRQSVAWRHQRARFDRERYEVERGSTPGCRM